MFSLMEVYKRWKQPVEWYDCMSTFPRSQVVRLFEKQKVVFSRMCMFAAGTW